MGFMMLRYLGKALGHAIAFGFLLISAAAASIAAGPTVHVSVKAKEQFGNPLTYDWRVTDGRIIAKNGASISWELPAGKGLHFAYVLISNGKGGYTERRIVVSTDSIGTPPEVRPDRDFAAPATTPPAGETYSAILRSGYYVSPLSNPSTSEEEGVYTPGVEAFLKSKTGFKTPVVKANLSGVISIFDVPPGAYRLMCRMDKALPFAVCNTGIKIGDEAANDPFVGPQDGRNEITGRLLLADGSPCGAEFGLFGVKSAGRATLFDNTGAVLAGPYTVNRYGHYSFGLNPLSTAVPATILLECEGAKASIPVPDYLNFVSARTLLGSTAAPDVFAMSAKLNGVDVGQYLPPPAGLASDNVDINNFYLAAKGLDSRMSACRYYLSIGAVTRCNSDGTFAGAISFRDWKRKMKMKPFLPAGAVEAEATYINRVDLNLTRNHHSVANNNRTAAYVCNHLGPTDETQQAVNTAINNAKNGRNLVACVAMDFSVSPGVNGNKPFVRFLIFGPSGELLPSVNLDGRGEKFVPGTCVACHGGDHYAGRFPETPLGSPGAGPANIGAHFLPYDTGNFSFSTKSGLTEADQEEAIYQLNQNVLKTDPPAGVSELIAGWYQGSHTLDKDYLPASWQAQSDLAKRFYHKVYAKSCRTCHVAFSELLNFDHFDNFQNSASPVHEDGNLRTSVAVCGGSSSWLRTFSMPNSLRTMNLFWESAGTADDQPKIVEEFAGISNNRGGCTLTPSPAP